MKISHIYQLLDELAPFETQEAWDNSGLLVGSMQSEFDSVVVAVDLDAKMVQNAAPKTLFITHHPLIFKGLKQLDFSRYPSSILHGLCAKECSLIALHTNADLAFLNKFVLSEVLGVKNFTQNGFLLEWELEKPRNFDDFAREVKSNLNLTTLRAVKANEEVRKIAFCTGSGADLLNFTEADCFLTGDLRYHTAVEARENGVSLIDITHYSSEVHFAKFLVNFLQKNSILAIIGDFADPFRFY